VRPASIGQLGHSIPLFIANFLTHLRNFVRVKGFKNNGIGIVVETVVAGLMRGQVQLVPVHIYCQTQIEKK